MILSKNGINKITIDVTMTVSEIKKPHIKLLI